MWKLALLAALALSYHIHTTAFAAQWSHPSASVGHSLIQRALETPSRQGPLHDLVSLLAPHAHDVFYHASVDHGILPPELDLPVHIASLLRLLARFGGTHNTLPPGIYALVALLSIITPLSLFALARAAHSLWAAVIAAFLAAVLPGITSRVGLTHDSCDLLALSAFTLAFSNLAWLLQRMRRARLYADGRDPVSELAALWLGAKAAFSLTLASIFGPPAARDLPFLFFALAFAALVLLRRPNPTFFLYAFGIFFSLPILLSLHQQLHPWSSASQAALMAVLLFSQLAYVIALLFQVSFRPAAVLRLALLALCLILLTLIVLATGALYTNSLLFQRVVAIVLRLAHRRMALPTLSITDTPSLQRLFADFHLLFLLAPAGFHLMLARPNDLRIFICVATAAAIFASPAVTSTRLLFVYLAPGILVASSMLFAHILAGANAQTAYDEAKGLPAANRAATVHNNRVRRVKRLRESQGERLVVMSASSSLLRPLLALAVLSAFLASGYFAAHHINVFTHAAYHPAEWKLAGDFPLAHDLEQMTAFLRAHVLPNPDARLITWGALPNTLLRHMANLPDHMLLTERTQDPMLSWKLAGLLTGSAQRALSSQAELRLDTNLHHMLLFACNHTHVATSTLVPDIHRVWAEPLLDKHGDRARPTLHHPPTTTVIHQVCQGTSTMPDLFHTRHGHFRLVTIAQPSSS